jgi:hypothetical protein
MKVNKKEYSIESGELIVNLSERDETYSKLVYGYSIEVNWSGNLKSRNSWHTYYTNKIYSSEKSAIDAILQIPKKGKESFRVVTLYRMGNMDFREYKINKILDNGANSLNNTNLKPKAWKAKQDFSIDHFLSIKRGSIFVKLGNRIIQPSKTQRTINFKYIDEHFKNPELFEEIELKDEKWLYPHLLKEFKEALLNDS